MYRCEFCKEVVAPRTPSHRVVVETREVRYPFRENANVRRAKKKEEIPDKGGAGREIVREAVVCPRCAAK